MHQNEIAPSLVMMDIDKSHFQGSFDTLQPKNKDFHEGKVIQNCNTKVDNLPTVPSVPSGFQVCQYCEILGHGKVKFRISWKDMEYKNTQAGQFIHN